MAKPDWTHGAPDEDALNGLVIALGTILAAYDEERRHAFAVAVSQALEPYFQDVGPGTEDDKTVRPALERVAKAAAEFTDAMERLGEASRLNLESGLYVVSGKSVMWPELTERTDATVAWASAISSSATRFLERPAKSGRPENRGVNWLVGELAASYTDSFSERPSWARSGVFTKVLRVVLPLAGVNVQIGEDRLKEIIANRCKAAPAPTRGRKRRSV